MKAIVYRRFGSPDVLEVEEVEKPVPKDDEVLIAVRAASINPADWHFMRGEPYPARLAAGLRKPRLQRLGVDFAGIVKATGEEVFGTARATLAEYVCAKRSAVIAKPANISFDEAGAVGVAAFTALQNLRAGGLQSGQKVLINGASGGVGTFAVQIAKSIGADVTAVCSGRNVEMVRSIGADRVIDYEREDFANDVARYDVFFDCIGNKSLAASRRVLKPKGVYVMVGGPAGRWFRPLDRFLASLIVSPFVSQKTTGKIAQNKREDLELIREMLETEKIKVVIDRRYTLGETREAMRYLEAGHARGKVVITFGAARTSTSPAPAR